MDETDNPIYKPWNTRIECLKYSCEGTLEARVVVVTKFKVLYDFKCYKCGVEGRWRDLGLARRKMSK